MTRRQFVGYFRTLSAVLFLTVFAYGAEAYANISAALSIEDGRVTSFYLAVGSHYNVPEKELIVVKKRQISDDDLVVVFYLARRANVSPSVIVDLRLSGKTWMEITHQYGFTAEIFYVAFEKDSNPPKGKAYGHFRNRHRKEWGTISLSDHEIVDLANLKFACDYHGYSPDEVAKMREEGQSFIAIHDKIKNSKANKKTADAKKTESTGGKGKGRK